MSKDAEIAASTRNQDNVLIEMRCWAYQLLMSAWDRCIHQSHQLKLLLQRQQCWIAGSWPLYQFCQQYHDTRWSPSDVDVWCSSKRQFADTCAALPELHYQNSIKIKTILEDFFPSTWKAVRTDTPLLLVYNYCGMDSYFKKEELRRNRSLYPGSRKNSCIKNVATFLLWDAEDPHLDKQQILQLIQAPDLQAEKPHIFFGGHFDFLLCAIAFQPRPTCIKESLAVRVGINDDNEDWMQLEHMLQTKQSPMQLKERTFTRAWHRYSKWAKRLANIVLPSNALQWSLGKLVQEMPECHRNAVFVVTQPSENAAVLYPSNRWVVVSRTQYATPILSETKRYNVRTGYQFVREHMYGNEIVLPSAAWPKLPCNRECWWNNAATLLPHVHYIRSFGDPPNKSIVTIVFAPWHLCKQYMTTVHQYTRYNPNTLWRVPAALETRVLNTHLLQLVHYELWMYYILPYLPCDQAWKLAWHAMWQPGGARQKQMQLVCKRWFAERFYETGRQWLADDNKRHPLHTKWWAWHFIPFRPKTWYDNVYQDDDGNNLEAKEQDQIELGRYNYAPGLSGHDLMRMLYFTCNDMRKPGVENQLNHIVRVGNRAYRCDTHLPVWSPLLDRVEKYLTWQQIAFAAHQRAFARDDHSFVDLLQNSNGTVDWARTWSLLDGTECLSTEKITHVVPKQLFLDDINGQVNTLDVHLEFGATNTHSFFSETLLVNMTKMKAYEPKSETIHLVGTYRLCTYAKCDWTSIPYVEKHAHVYVARDSKAFELFGPRIFEFLEKTTDYFHSSDDDDNDHARPHGRPVVHKKLPSQRYAILYWKQPKPS